MPMAVQSMSDVWSRLFAGAVGPNPAAGKNVRLLFFCVVCR